MENTTGGNFIHLLSAMERTVYGDNEICKRIGVHFDPIDEAKSFEEADKAFLGFQSIMEKVSTQYVIASIRNTMNMADEFYDKDNRYQGKDMEEREPLFTIGGNVNWCSYYVKQYRGSSKN